MSVNNTQTSLDTLKAYNDEYETWIAESLDDVKAMVLEQQGGKPEDYYFDAYREMRPDERLTIWFEDGSIAEIGKGHKETKTVAEWIAFNGRGFLCGTE